MGKIIEPNVKVDDIVYWFDADSKVVEKTIEAWGRFTPVVKINEITLSYGDIKRFTLETNINNIVTFSLTLDDQLFKIRESLKKTVDTGVIRVGYKNWALKFNCIFDKTNSRNGSSVVYLQGSIYDERLYNNSDQKCYNNMSIQDILKDICETTGLGLYVHENETLTNKINTKIINHGETPLNFINYLITNFTDNVWFVDANYYLHVGCVSDIKQEDVATYSLDWKDGSSVQDREFTFIKKSKNLESQENDVMDIKIPIKSYDITSNYSELFKESRHCVICTENDVLDIKQNVVNDTLVIDNTFSCFETNKNPFYENIVNKYINGNSIEILIEHLMIELNVLDLINLELWNAGHESNSVLDEEHSGKKVVLGYKLEYVKSNDASISRINQIIYCN